MLPLHPRTAQQIARWGLDLGPLVVCEPLGYLDMHRLLQSAAAVYTDSGGLQKEAYFHRVPCVTLRSETEWVETSRRAGTGCGTGRIMRRVATSRRMATGMPPRKRSN